jgi:DNA-binding GntR family transcriptional regulator
MEVMNSFLISMNPGKKYIKRILDHHKEIYEALRERNLKKAKEKMEEHLLDVNRKLYELLNKPTVSRKEEKNGKEEI